MRKTNPTKSAPNVQKVTTRQKDAAFANTMAQARSHMGPLARSFSVVIHCKPVAFVSDVLGRTLFRPLPLLFGASSGLILTLVFYGVAKYYGYALSGSEMYIFFGLGWVVGLIVDYALLLIHGSSATHRR